MLRLGEFVEELRDLFKDCEHNRYDNVSICVKTMYKKLLDSNSKQETYWNYTDAEQEILQKLVLNQTWNFSRI